MADIVRNRPAIKDVPLREFPGYVRLHVLGMNNMKRLANNALKSYAHNYFSASAPKGIFGRFTPIIHLVMLGGGLNWFFHRKVHGHPTQYDHHW